MSAAGWSSRLRVVSSLRRGPVASLRHGVPQGGRGVVQPQVHVAVLGEGGEHLQPGGGEPAGAEHRDAVGKVAELAAGRGAAAQASSSSSAGLGVPRVARSRRHSSACQARSSSSGLPSPRLVTPGRPGTQHLRPRLAVLVEHRGQPPCDCEPTSFVLGADAEVLRERPAPRLRWDRRVDDARAAATPTARAPNAARRRHARPRRPRALRRPGCSATGS